jgi:tetratricopeptide (TPR) repeat protein
LTSVGRHTLLCVRARLLGRQSRVTGDLNLLEDAIELTREAIALCPSKHRAYPVHVSGLMFLLGTHFESTGRIECLDEIISFAHLDSVIKSPWLACNIATAMRDRAQLASVGTAITLLQRAIRILRARSQPSANLFPHEKAAICHELGAVYDLQAELGIGIDHESRLQLARDAVEMGRDSFEGRTEATIGLVRALLHRASHAFNESLAEEAEDLIRDELKDDQLLDHLRASLTALQAELVVVRSGIQAIPIDLAVAWQMFETIMTDTSARPRDRLRIAIRWATLAESIDAKSALLAYRRAVDVLPQVGYIGEDLIGRSQALREARDLAPRTASFALGAGEVKKAIELLEHSRGVLWQQSLYLRPPLHLLPPHLVPQFAEVSKTLDSSETNAAERRQAAERFQSIVLEIRRQPGYENFLLPRTYDQLVGQLPEGYAVWLIPHKSHCDIIIINSRARTQPIHFRHGDLNLDRLQAIASAFTTLHASALRSIDRKTRPAPLPKNNGTSSSHEPLLEELWASLVQRIIRTLDVLVSVIPRLGSKAN